MTQKRSIPAPPNARWLSYDAARARVHEAGITRGHDYRSQARRQWRLENRLPSNPNLVYTEWRGWGAFLTPEPRPYTEAKALVQMAQIESARDYRSRARRDWRTSNRLPSDPAFIYKTDWNGWDVFLGSPVRWSYAEAKARARAEGIQTHSQYARWAKDLGQPSYPPRSYRNEWEGWNTFLGRSSRRKFAPYLAAKRVVQHAGVASSSDYISPARKEFRHLMGLPSQPAKVYAGAWEGWDAFLGQSEPPSSKFISYLAAKRVVQSAGVVSSTDYLSSTRKELRRLMGLPSRPDHVYASEWAGWPDFLGAAYSPEPGRKRFQLAKLTPESVDRILAAVHRKRISTSYDYKSLLNGGWRKEHDLPRDPEHHFGSDWEGWAWFLGESFDAEKESAYDAMILNAGRDLATTDEN